MASARPMKVAWGKLGMKRKMNCAMQPKGTSSPRADQTRQEIQNFRLAIDSYPARVAKDPTLTFQRHLCSFFVTDRLQSQ
jgi:hypothetical protein